LLAVSDTKGTF